MADFTLPKNSKVTKGKRHKAPADAKNIRVFNVYRWYTIRMIVLKSSSNFLFYTCEILFLLRRS